MKRIKRRNGYKYQSNIWRDSKMKRVIKAINYYFFPDDEGEGVHWSDYAWFYGTLGLMVVILISLLFADLAN